MLLSEIMCGLAGAIVALAIARIVRRQIGTQRGAEGAREYERRVKAAASKITTIGITRLGTGARKAHVIQVVSTGFELRAADGTIVHVAAGVLVDLFASNAQLLADGTVELPASTALLYLPPDNTERAATPYKAAGGIAYTRGDSLLLFTQDAVLFGMPARRRTTSFFGLAIYGGGTALSIIEALAEGPNTAWNGMIFLIIVFGGMDQIFRGTVSWIACTRAPPPLKRR